MEHAAVIETVKHLSDKDKDFLAKAQGGIPLYEADSKHTKALMEKGLLKEIKYEYVHATTSVPGVILSDDGQKVLQSIEGEVNLKVTKIDEVVNGERIPTTKVEVKNPSVEGDPTVEVDDHATAKDTAPKDNLNLKK